MYLKYKKYLIYPMLLILGACMALLASRIGLDKLSLYADNGDYHLSRIDLFVIAFVSDDVSNYPYLSKSNINMLFLPFSFYFISLVISCSTFLLKEKGYFNFIYSRIGSKAKAMKWIKGSGMRNFVCFLLAYNIMLYTISHKCYLSGLQISEKQLICYLMLHSVNMILAINFLQEVVFQVFCIKGVTEAFFTGTILLIVLIISDMTIANINILMFNKEQYFIDGIIINIIIYLLLKHRKRGYAVQLPY